MNKKCINKQEEITYVGPVALLFLMLIGFPFFLVLFHNLLIHGPNFLSDEGSIISIGVILGINLIIFDSFIRLNTYVKNGQIDKEEKHAAFLTYSLYLALLNFPLFIVIILFLLDVLPNTYNIKDIVISISTLGYLFIIIFIIIKIITFPNNENSKEAKDLEKYKDES
ncbi:MAG: hypothetical protein ACO2ON_01630 [Candidatus Nanopusillus sp.]